MALRVQSIKHSWHGRDPNIKGLGTPPKAREQKQVLVHFCRHCQNQLRRKTLGMHKLPLQSRRFSYTPSESTLNEESEEDEEEEVPADECDGFHSNYSCDAELAKRLADALQLEACVL